MNDTGRTYYNENDPKKCAAIQALMDDGFISRGCIDDRSIRDVSASDLKGFERCHFFAGIGLWDYALNLAQWPEGYRVWTGSCPCQPYSTAGRQKGKTDDRHLWPEWERVITECEPPIIFGEQVASAVSFGWLDDVYKGLEAKGYAVGSAVLPAVGVGAPHRRDRLWFVATNNRCQRIQRRRKKALSWERPFSWCKDVGGIEALRSRSDLPEPLIRTLDDGNTENVGILHSIGDAIVPQVAAGFIQSAWEALA